jgi:hypothetical protein
MTDIALEEQKAILFWEVSDEALEVAVGAS